MSGKRYTEEFKLDAIKQITERGYKIGDVAERLGVTYKSLKNSTLRSSAVSRKLGACQCFYGLSDSKRLIK